MDVVSACPLPVASLLWQPRAGAFVLTVVCKATYTLRPVESPLAPDQDPPNELDDHWNDDERWSLHGVCDLSPFKPRADVFLVGHAHAARGQPVSSLTVRMIVGDVDKSIEVHADRAWTQDAQLLEGPRFTRMPLRYERAGGGLMTSNPVGMRPDARPDSYGRVPVPNLQPPGYHLARPGDAIPPVGLGPIAPAWPGRAAKLYGYAAGWDHRTGLAQPLPQGLDPGFFNVAPPDQQTTELRSDERIVLEYLHPEFERLVTSLSGPSPLAVVERAGAAPQTLFLCCDTLSIDTDRGVCSLVWRGQLRLRAHDEAGRVVIAGAGERPSTGVETLGGGMQPAAAPPIAQLKAGFKKDVLRTMPGVPAGAIKPALPFREASPQEGGAAAAQGTWARTDDEVTRPRIVIRDASGEVLPFVAAAPSGDAPPRAQTLPILRGARPREDGALPWASPEAPPPEAAAPSGEAPRRAPTLPIFAGARPKPLEDGGLPWQTGLRLQTPWAPVLAGDDGPPRVVAPPPDLPAPAEPPAPPPMIGPLATPEMYAASQAPPAADASASPEEPPPATQPVAPPQVEPAAEEITGVRKPSRPTVTSSIAHCATVAARLDGPGADRAAILAAEDLTPAQWDKDHARWLGEIRDELDRGKKKLLSAYDAAYVTALEDRRGPIAVDEYARLSIAAERGKAAAALAELDLPEDAMMRIRRVWLARMVKDPRAAAEVRAAMRAAAE